MAEEIEFRAGGYLPASFLDWEGHLSAVIFSTGCSVRCPWCHNGELVRPGAEPLDLQKLLHEIERRAKFLDGVVISGGEPTLQPGLMELARRVRALGLPVKLDTNGSRPDILRALLEDGLAAHVAMDVKAPLEAEAYSRLTGTAADIGAVTESVSLLKKLAPSYEFRTTFVPGLLSFEELLKIREELNDDGRWFVQCFKPNGCLDEAFLSVKAADPEELKRLLPGVSVRG